MEPDEVCGYDQLLCDSPDAHDGAEPYCAMNDMGCPVRCADVDAWLVGVPKAVLKHPKACFGYLVAFISSFRKGLPMPHTAKLPGLYWAELVLLRPMPCELSGARGLLLRSVRQLLRAL